MFIVIVLSSTGKKQQHNILKKNKVQAYYNKMRRRSVRSPGTLCIGALRSLRQDPALSVSGPRRCLCRGPALSVSGSLWRGPLSRALCVGTRRSVCRAPALSVSGCVGPGALPALSVCGPCTLCVRTRRSLCRALCVGGPALSRALCVGTRRSVCRAPALSVSGCVGPSALPALSVCGPCTLCVRTRRSLCRALCVGGPALSRALCVGPALCPGALCVWPGSDALCVGPRRCLCRAYVSGPRAWCSLCVRVPPIPSAGPQLQSAGALRCVPPRAPYQTLTPCEQLRAADQYTPFWEVRRRITVLTEADATWSLQTAFRSIP